MTSTGAVKCWGTNYNGELGDGTASNYSSIPVSVVGLSSGALAVSSAGTHSCAVTSADAIKCWGGNSYGELGDGTTTDTSVPVDVVGRSSGAVTVSAGDSDSCALTKAGAVRCWGSNASGELGDGTTTDSSVPVYVEGLG